MSVLMPVLQESPAFDGMAVDDDVDRFVELLVSSGGGVVTGCQVTQHTGSDMAVNVAAGAVIINNQLYLYAGTTALAISSASSGDRRDTVVLRLSGTTVTATVVQGAVPAGLTGAWSRSTFPSTCLPPVKGPIIGSGTSGVNINTDVPVAEVYVAYNTTAIVSGSPVGQTPTTGNIVDKTGSAPSPIVPQYTSDQQDVVSHGGQAGAGSIFTGVGYATTVANPPGLTPTATNGTSTLTFSTTNASQVIVGMGCVGTGITNGLVTAVNYGTGVVTVSGGSALSTSNPYYFVYASTIVLPTATNGTTTLTVTTAQANYIGVGMIVSGDGITPTAVAITSATVSGTTVSISAVGTWTTGQQVQITGLANGAGTNWSNANGIWNITGGTNSFTYTVATNTPTSTSNNSGSAYLETTVTSVAAGVVTVGNGTIGTLVANTPYTFNAYLNTGVTIANTVASGAALTIASPGGPLSPSFYANGTQSFVTATGTPVTISYTGISSAGLVTGMAVVSGTTSQGVYTGLPLNWQPLIIPDIAAGASIMRGDGATTLGVSDWFSLLSNVENNEAGLVAQNAGLVFPNFSQSYYGTLQWNTAGTGSGASTTTPIGSPVALNITGAGTLTITATSGTGSVCTFTAANSMSAGQTVTFAGLGGAFGTEFNGTTQTVTGATATTFTVAGTATNNTTGTATFPPQPLPTSVLVKGSTSGTISAVSGSGTAVTITCTNSFTSGTVVYLTGLGGGFTALNGTFQTVLSTGLSTSQFEITSTLTGTTSTTGTASTSVGDTSHPYRRVMLFFQKQTNGDGLICTAVGSTSTLTKSSTTIDTNGSGLAVWDSGDLGFAGAGAGVYCTWQSHVSGSGGAGIVPVAALFIQSAGTNGCINFNCAQGGSTTGDWTGNGITGFTALLQLLNTMGMTPRRLITGDMAGNDSILLGTPIATVQSNLTSFLSAAASASPLTQQVVMGIYNIGSYAQPGVGNATWATVWIPTLRNVAILSNAMFVNLYAALGDCSQSANPYGYTWTDHLHFGSPVGGGYPSQSGRSGQETIAEIFYQKLQTSRNFALSGTFQSGTSYDGKIVNVVGAQQNATAGEGVAFTEWFQNTGDTYPVVTVGNPYSFGSFAIFNQPGMYMGAGGSTTLDTGLFRGSAGVVDVISMLIAKGPTGATAAYRWAGSTNTGLPPTLGTFVAGDFILSLGSVWVCTASGSPGIWARPGEAISSSSSNSPTIPITAQVYNWTPTSTATPTIATSGAVDGMLMTIRIYASVTISSWTGTENSTVSFPSSSTGSSTSPQSIRAQFNAQTTKWRCIGLA